MIADVKAKDVTPEQIASIRQNIAQRQQNRRIEIEINEAIQMVNQRGKQKPRPTKAPVKKKKPLGHKLTKAIKIIIASSIGTAYMLWYIIKNIPTSGWLLILTTTIVAYLWRAII